jgi:hypothetical protein
MGLILWHIEAWIYGSVIVGWIAVGIVLAIACIFLWSCYTGLNHLVKDLLRLRSRSRPD